MERRILRLGRSLRAAGAPLSPPEIGDAARAALAVGVERRGDLRAALAAALVKEARFLPAFGRLFDREFPAGLGLKPRGRGTAAKPGSPGGEGGEGSGGRNRQPLSLEGRGPGEGGEGEERENEARGDEPGETVAGAGQGAGPDGSGLDAAPRVSRIPGPSPILAKSFRERWTRAEEREALEAMEEFARRLAARLSRRRERARRGALDVKATLRANLRHGGVPFHLVRRARRRDRPDLLLLADVSGSVRNAARLFLLLLGHLRGRFAGVRAFAYTDRPAEIPAAAAALGPEGLAAALAPDLPLDALSDHGEVLRRFNRDFGRAVGGRTVVVLLGDGRNNRFPAQGWELEAIRRRARRVIWIVPERAALLGGGDSAMPEYAPHCDRVLAAPDAAALAEAFLGLVAGRVPSRSAAG